MKTILTALVTVTLFFSVQINSQNKVLKINFGEDENEWVMYPPKTKFTLKDKAKTIVFSNKDGLGKFEINGVYRLEIFPKYKETADVYVIEKGSIEIIEKDYFTNKKYKAESTIVSAKKKQHSNGIAATKTITNSDVKKGRKNLVLKFTNGIIFTYTDGKTSSKFNNNDLYIEGKYLVYSKLGVAKISFNPKNGETWWVFQ